MGFLSRRKDISDDLKQVIVIRQDLKLPKGKAAAQAAHASVEAVLASPRQLVDAWHRQGMKKIVVKVTGESQLRELQRRARAHGVISRSITDAGKTVVAPGTLTAVGIGPDQEGKIDQLTGDLPMY